MGANETVAAETAREGQQPQVGKALVRELSDDRMNGRTLLLLELWLHHVGNHLLVEARPLDHLVVAKERVPRAGVVLARDPERLPLPPSSHSLGATLLLPGPRRKRRRHARAARVRQPEARVGRPAAAARRRSREARVLLVGRVARRRRVARVRHRLARLRPLRTRPAPAAVLARRRTDADARARERGRARRAGADRGGDVCRAAVGRRRAADGEDGARGAVARRADGRDGRARAEEVEPVAVLGRVERHADVAFVVLCVLEARVVALAASRRGRHGRRGGRRRDDRAHAIEEARDVGPGRGRGRRRRERVAQRDGVQLSDNVVEELLHRCVARLRDVDREDGRTVRRPRRR